MDAPLALGCPPPPHRPASSIPSMPASVRQLTFTLPSTSRSRMATSTPFNPADYDLSDDRPQPAVDRSTRDQSVPMSPQRHEGVADQAGRGLVRLGQKPDGVGNDVVGLAVAGARDLSPKITKR